MKFSRFGIFIFLILLSLLVSSCGQINRVLARRNLVDGSKAYKDRKFPEAEQLFRAAVARDPNGETSEGKTAQVFLARTIHSEYVGNRNPSFSESDFLGDEGLNFTKKIWGKSDPLSASLFDQITPETKEVYTRFTGMDANSTDGDTIKKRTETRKVFLGNLANDMNKIIGGDKSLYDPQTFKNVKLSDFTQQYMNAQPAGEKITRLNRLLLEDAYPGDIAKKPKPEDAIAEYLKALAQNPKDQSSYKAVASLYENLQMQDKWLDWVTKRANDASLPPEQRGEALTSLAAKKNTCANDISDTDATKKKTTKDGKPAFEFVKPAKPEDFETLKGCVADGMKLIDQAMALEPADVKSAGTIDVKSLKDADLKAKMDYLKVFESARSYKASLTFQAMRVAEMSGQTADRDRLKSEAEAARTYFNDLGDVVKKFQTEIEARAAVEEEKGKTANKNAAANK